MSAFELAAWNWHCENVLPITVNSGLFRDLFMELGLAGKVRVLFLKALAMIDATNAKVAKERAEKEAEAKNGR